jgi:hypothetical protein
MPCLQEDSAIAARHSQTTTASSHQEAIHIQQAAFAITAYHRPATYNAEDKGVPVLRRGDPCGSCQMQTLRLGLDRWNDERRKRAANDGKEDQLNREGVRLPHCNWDRHRYCV